MPETTVAKVTVEKASEEPKTVVKEAFDFALNYKEKLVSITTISSYKNRIDYFVRWMTKNHLEIKTINTLTKKIVLTKLDIPLYFNCSFEILINLRFKSNSSIYV